MTRYLLLGAFTAFSMLAQTSPVVPAASDFRIVRSDGYEGAIVPASSPWHGFFTIAITRNRGITAQVPADVTPWTPEPADVQATEAGFSDFLARAAKDRAAVLAGLAADDRSQVEGGLTWLIANVTTLKRQYFGFATGGARHLAVHGAPDDPAHRWRSEGRAMMGGGCGNYWLDFHLTERRIVRFTCGGDESPAQRP